MALSIWSAYRKQLKPKSDLHNTFFRSTHRYASIDGARALTISMLVLFHVMYGVVRLLQKNSNEDKFIQEFPEWLNWLWHAQGSDPLFVVCGLLVSFSLLKELDRDKTIGVRSYFMRRLSRTYPLFLLALLIYTPVDNDNVGYLLSNLLFISNYVPSDRTIVPVGWSLDLQMIFYFLVPFFYLYVFVHTRYKVSLLVTLLVASVVWRLAVIYMEPSLYQRPFYDAYTDSDHARLLANTIYYDFDMRVGSFIMGMLAAVIHLYHGEKVRLFLSAHVVFNTVLLLTGLFLIYISVSVPFHNKFSAFYENFDPWVNFIFLGLARYGYSFGIVITIFLVMNPSGPVKLVDRIFRTPLLYPLAQLIYPIYLFHFPFIVLAAATVFGTVDRYSIYDVAVWQVFAIFGVAMIYTVLFSLVVHIFIEKPVIRMADHKYRNKPIAATPKISQPVNA